MKTNAHALKNIVLMLAEWWYDYSGMPISIEQLLNVVLLEIFLRLKTHMKPIAYFMYVRLPPIETPNLTISSKECNLNKDIITTKPNL